jgi:HSP20 family protein
MTLKKWEPLRELDDLLDRSRRTLGLTPWHSREWLGERDWSPRVDIGETDNTFVIKAEIPGVKREDVKVSVQNGVLLLDGERNDETSEQGLHFHRVERFHGSFNRSFTLPPSVDPNQVKANFNEGVLTISLAKLPGSESAAREVLVE